MMHFDLLNLFKITATSVALGVSTDIATNTLISDTHLNISVTVFIAALLGSGTSLCFGETKLGKREALTQILSSAIFGITLGLLAAEALNLTWAKQHLGLFVLLISAMTRWFLPTVISRLQTLITEFNPKLKKD